MSSAPPVRIYRFADVEVRPAERGVLVGGKQVALGGRAFDLLVALIERAGRLVAKDELLDAVWGRVVVEEANLHVQVSALRRLLGADVIATIPGRGYRFTPALDGIAGAGRAASAAPTTTGTASSGLFGRDRDLAALIALIAAHRAITVAGPGGIGKTRLARAAISECRALFPDGAAMVELAALADATLVPSAIAAALQVPLRAGGDPVAALVASVAPLRMLVVLDNAEQVAEGVARVVQAFVAASSTVTLLVTSQVPLRVEGEQLYRLGGLDVPGPDENVTPETALRHGALALFVDRLRAADRHFTLDARTLPHAIAICRQLDGIALAIELAAARAPLLGLSIVAQRLDERFKLLRSGARTAPTRQQTLLAAMDWTHGLLTREQQIAFRQLGVFAGGFTLDLARQVLDQPGVDACGSIDLLADLVDRSLVAVDAGEAPRYRLLETGRAYALLRLADSGEEDGTRRRHAAALGDLFETAYDECWSLPEADFVARYEPELDNLRSALEWSMVHAPETAIALAGASGRLWRWLSLHPEALVRLRAAAERIRDDTPPAIAARLFEAIAQLSGEISSADSRPAARRALSFYEAIGDARGRYLALGHIAFSYRSGSPEADAAYASMQALEDPRWPASVRLVGTKVAGGLASDARRIDAARAAHEARLRLATEAGSEREVNAALGNLADLALIAGDADEAVRRGSELLERLGRRHMATRAIALGNLLLALLAQGNFAAARATLVEFLLVSRQLGDLFLTYAADAMALLAANEDRFESAALLLGYADAAYAAQGQAREPNEARARDDASSLLAAAVDGGAAERWRARGAALDAEAVRKVALD